MAGRERLRAAVIGHPVAHSLSPALHRAAYSAIGLAWTYEAVDVTADQLPGFLRGLDAEWAGLSLTMPLKRAVLPLLDRVSPLAGSVGVVNTVTFSDAGSLGDNTDVGGIVAALATAGVSSVGSAAVLGGGATAASALAALRSLGCAGPVVHTRSPERAAALGVPVLPLDDPSWTAADVVVSTLPAGAADALVLPDRVTGVLLDVAYDPWPSRLATDWTAAGGLAVDGFEMLLHQAAAQVELMTGRSAPLEAMRAAVPRPTPRDDQGTPRRSRTS